jgi:hypothetical protein
MKKRAQRAAPFEKSRRAGAFLPGREIKNRFTIVSNFQYTTVSKKKQEIFVKK